jgi:hypothetical protein
MNNKQPLVLSCDDIVIGSSLEAVFFAHNLKCKLLFTRNLCPFEFEVFPSEYNFNCTPYEFWSQHMFELSMAGYIPISNAVTIYLVDKNRLKVVTETENIVYIDFKHMYVFDDNELYDIPIETDTVDKHVTIYDFFYYKRFNKLRDTKSTEDTHFYVHKMKKYCIVKTIANESEIPEEYTVRLRTLSKFKEEKPDKKKIFEHIKRYIVYHRRNVRQDTENITFCYPDFYTLYRFSKKRQKIDYMRYLRTKMDLKWPTIIWQELFPSQDNH